MVESDSDGQREEASSAMLARQFERKLKLRRRQDGKQTPQLRNHKNIGGKHKRVVTSVVLERGRGGKKFTTRAMEAEISRGIKKQGLFAIEERTPSHTTTE